MPNLLKGSTIAIRERLIFMNLLVPPNIEVRGDWLSSLQSGVLHQYCFCKKGLWSFLPAAIQPKIATMWPDLTSINVNGDKVPSWLESLARKLEVKFNVKTTISYG